MILSDIKQWFFIFISVYWENEKLKLSYGFFNGFNFIIDFITDLYDP
jgi:hypothetical protein